MPHGPPHARMHTDTARPIGRGIGESTVPYGPGRKNDKSEGYQGSVTANAAPPPSVFEIVLRKDAPQCTVMGH